MCMRAAALFGLALASILSARDGAAQSEVPKLTVKSGESVEVDTVYWVVNCKSTMIGLPNVEVLEGPPGITFRIKEEQVQPLRATCPSKVSGAKLMLTATGVTEPTEVKLTYRLKYKTLDGDRQRAGSYILLLNP